MRIAVFGGSRGVGKCAVDEALERGHRVVALSRSGFAADGRDVEMLAGDARDPGLVAAALRVADAVVVALGASPFAKDKRDRRICSEGTRTILAGLAGQAPRPFVVVSSYGVGPTSALRPFPFNLIAATLLREVMADKDDQERDVRTSSLPWTIVQPLGLTDGPRTGMAYISADGRRVSKAVSRADVAAVCLDVIEQRRYVHESIAVSS